MGKEEGLTGATKRVMAYVQKVIDYRLGLVEREIEESGLSEDNGDRRLDQLIAKQGSKAKPKDD